MSYDPISEAAERLTRDIQKRNRLAAKRRRQSRMERRVERRKDTRRKILVGALIITAAESDPALQRRIEELLETKLTRAGDRVLFGLPELETAPGKGTTSERPDRAASRAVETEGESLRQIHRRVSWGGKGSGKPAMLVSRRV